MTEITNAPIETVKPIADRRARLTQMIIAAWLIVYVIAGLRNAAQFISIAPIPDTLLWDFHYYERALIDAQAGRDPYAIRDIGPAYLYPPPALIIIQLFAWLPEPVVKNLVFIVAQIALVIGIVNMVARYYRLPLLKCWYWYPLALFFGPFLDVLHAGQINVITEFGIALLFIGETAYPVAAGAGLAVAILTKVTPVLFLAYLFVMRRWRALLWTILFVLLLCVAALLLYGVQPFLQYPSVFQGLTQVRTVSINAQALAAKIADDLAIWHSAGLPLVGPLGWLYQTADTSPQTIQGVLTAYLGLIMVASGICATFTGKREPFFIIVALGSLLSSNVLWYHHYVFFLLPLLIWLGWKPYDLRLLLWCLCGLLLIQVDRWSLTYGLLIHLFGHVTILILLIGQISEVDKMRQSGKLPAWRELLRSAPPMEAG